MGLYKRGETWWMSFTANGKQKCESTKTTNKRSAQKILDRRTAEILEGRFHLVASTAPKLEAYSRQFLDTIRNPNTKKRYASSRANLQAYFGDVSLARITTDAIEGFKTARIALGVRPATVNRDLAVLRRMLKIAAKRRLLPVSPFSDVEMFEERKDRRQPHILTFEEEERLLSKAPNHIRVLVVVILETGLRSRREALALSWRDIDFADETIQIRQSKSLAGVRSVPMTPRCKAELLAWRNARGPEFSEHVFANPSRPSKHLTDVRVAWENALKDAGLDAFWIYDLRHTFASRITEAGAPQIFVAQLMGHSNPNILQTYAKAIDEYRRSAIRKLGEFRQLRLVKPMNHGDENSATIN
jgi:integrase